MQHFTHTISAEDARQPLSVVAAQLLGAPGLRAVERGGAWLDGRRVSEPDSLPSVGSELVLRLPPGGCYAELALTAADIGFEDRWLIAVHKRSGWYVGATPWDGYGNVLAAMERYLTARDGVAPKLHLAHQLDRDTSGVLLLSKDPAINPALQALFAGKAMTKRYQAICAGQPPTHGTITTGHGRAAGGRWRVYPLAEVGRSLPAGGGRVRLAQTSYQVVGRAATAAFLALELHTGRTHQIRLHLAHLGHPLLGDARYGGPVQYDDLVLEGHLLHAALMRFVHPQTGMQLELVSPLPNVMAAISRAMG